MIKVIGDVAQLARALDWQSKMAEFLVSRNPYIERLLTLHENSDALVGLFQFNP